tara:strand:+ start:3633 stop:4415 length:783 start_codon:yes stop_codon:yes gene_type:complete
MNWPTDITYITVTNDKVTAVSKVTVYHNEKVFSSFSMIRCPDTDDMRCHGKYMGYNKGDKSITTFTVANCDIRIIKYYAYGMSVGNTKGLSCREWYPSGQLKTEIWRDGDNRHRDGLPSHREWYPNGQLKEEKWYSHDTLYNEHGPSMREWYEDGQLKEERYISGSDYVENGPVRREWYPSGQLKVEDVAFGKKDGYATVYKSWYEDGRLRSEYWKCHDVFHRGEGKPAIQKWDEEGNLIKEKWYYRGRCQESVLTKRAR